MTFNPIFNAFAAKPKPSGFGNSSGGGLNMIRDNFSLTTLLMSGAFIQGLLCLLPYRNIALVAPVTLALGYSFVRAMLQSYGVLPNPYMNGVVPGRSAALFPDENGSYEKPAGDQVCVIMLGTKSSHPLGMFAPGAKDVGQRFMNMAKELHADSSTNGYLGSSPEDIGLMYFDSIQSLHDFAHGPTHTEAMEWWAREGPGLKHIGLMHEVFMAPKNSWEGIYVNYPPIGLGGTAKQAVVNNEKVWLNPLVNVKGKLLYSKGRMGRPFSEKEWPQFERTLAEGETY